LSLSSQLSADREKQKFRRRDSSRRFVL
jgi:hypothetical protein